MARQQLPPQIKKVDVLDRSTGKTAVRYRVKVDVGAHPETGKRQQAKRHCRTEQEARRVLAELQNKAITGTYVSPSKLTVEQMCANYVAGRHNLRESSLSKLAYDLAPLRERHGKLPAQRLTKAHIDQLVTDLVAGGTKTAKGRTRRAWSPVAVNKVISTIDQVLDDALEQKIVTANVAAKVARVSSAQKDVDTFTTAEVDQLRTRFAKDRIGHAWELALYGLRRGEIAGLRWADVDLKAKTLAVANNRVSAGGATVENDPKSHASRRELPLPARLVTVLRAAKKRQAAERLALGEHYGSGEYVVSNEIGEPYNPAVLSRYWAAAVNAAGVRHIKLHGGRHTAATLMHLDGVPVAVIAAWIGHSDPTLTLRVYAHSQDEALKAAGRSLDGRPNKSSV
ncbi:tyrosine-type recombinase/integrase [Mycolicibacterium iranicum]|uniref:tyrosine-type recombinase/integrase n=1 Tax=Mycolicibacterium iranicum TaxID=912594 RepID=UPI000464DD8C|nr:site-specific integrase [Mycolicibacterium iranicum]